MGKRRGRGSGELSWVSAGLARIGVLLLLLINAPLAVETVDTWRETRGMAEAPICGVGEGPDGCLVREWGAVSGPGYSRGPGSDWRFQPASRPGATSVELSTLESGRLEGRINVFGLYWHGLLVAFYDPADGAIIETMDFGHQSWLLLLFCSLFVIAMVIVFDAVARRKRAVAGGWWSRPPKLGQGEVPLGAAQTPALVLSLASIAGFFPLSFGSSPMFAATASVGVAAVVVVVSGVTWLRTGSTRDRRRRAD